jgi:hypothetical protein
LEIREFQDLIRRIYLHRDAKRGSDKTSSGFSKRWGTHPRLPEERRERGEEMADILACSYRSLIFWKSTWKVKS